LHPENNQYIENDTFSSSQKLQSKLRASSAIEMKKNEKLEEVTKNLNSGQYKSALENIVELEKIKLFKKQNTTDGFDLKQFLRIKPSNMIDKELKGTVIPTIDVSDIRLSKSGFETYLKCPQMFKFERVWNARPVGDSTTMYRGTAFHNVVAKAADPGPDGLNNVHKLEDLVKILDEQWDKTKFLGSTKSEEALAKKEIAMLLGVYQKWTESNPNKVVGTEVEFRMKIGGKSIIGYIDRIEQTPQGDYHLIDYKTGMGKNMGPVEDDVQLNLYSQACKNGIKNKQGEVIVKPGAYPEKAILFYPEKPDGERIYEYDVTDSSVKKIMEKLEDVVKQIDKKEFTATPEYHCKWCDYKTICEDAQI
jgi:DNA helicase-2/ATP-dependent DNA helicase PcrA